MIELFVSDKEKDLESIGREFAYIMGKQLEGPFITKYQGVFPVEELTKCKYDHTYSKYVALAVLSGKKYGIQLRNELLCGM
jgi:hypothetical protein